MEKAFGADFFRDEVRCGFHISTAIKQAWAGSLSVLLQIDRLCQKTGITYFAEWGSLLGAVRHGGFIPWDDDLDIAMRRRDYERFKEAVMQGGLPEGFTLQDFRNQDDHWLFLARICNTGHICFGQEHLESFYNFPYISGIDIFILDDLYADPELERARCEEVKQILATADGIISGKLSREAVRSQLKMLEDKYKESFDESLTPRDLGIALYDLAERQMARTKPEESDKVGQIFPWILKGGEGLPTEYYEKMVRIPFESVTIPVPAAYHLILKKRYGEYFTIKKAWNGHEYPFFEGQKEALLEVSKEEPELADRFLSDDIGSHINPEAIPEAADDTCEYLQSEASGNILFLAAGPGLWSGLEPWYENYTKKKDCSVTVVALPVVVKNPCGSLSLDGDELDNAAGLSGYPSDVKLTQWWDLDIRRLKPELIFIQDPYDETNPVLGIPPEYFTGRIRRFAKRIVYVPPFECDDFSSGDEKDIYNLRRLALTPGVFYSDGVVVSSEVLRQRWLEVLTSYTGDESLGYWERKLICKKDLQGIFTCTENKDHTKDHFAKRLLFVIGADILAEYDEKAVPALERRLETVKNASSVLKTDIMFYPSDLKQWKSVNADVTEKIFKLVDRFVQSGDVHYFDSACGQGENAEKYDAYDAYYGSSSPYVTVLRRAGKPVMIADLGSCE